MKCSRWRRCPGARASSFTRLAAFLRRHPFSATDRVPTKTRKPPSSLTRTVSRKLSPYDSPSVMPAQDNTRRLRRCSLYATSAEAYRMWTFHIIASNAQRRLIGSLGYWGELYAYYLLLTGGKRTLKSRPAKGTSRRGFRVLDSCNASNRVVLDRKRPNSSIPDCYSTETECPSAERKERV